MFFIVAIATLLICDGQSTKDNLPVPEAGNLMYTFGNNDEVPAAFFDNAQREERKNSPPCQDGSGGICVEAGQCPPNLRPQESLNSTNVCPTGLECCFGPAVNDLTCRSRGGECRPARECGNGPVFKEATDCGAGEACCIFV